MLDLFGPTTGAGGVTTRPGDGRAFSVTDTFFRDCSSATLDDGTEFQAAWFNQVLAVLRALARGNGQTGAAADIVTQDNSDDLVILKAIQQLIQRGQPTYAADTGTADALVVSPSPAYAEYKPGMRLLVKKSPADNATTAPTIAVSTLPPIPAVDRRGNPLAPGDLPANSILDFEFDGANARMLGVVSADVGKLHSFTNVKMISTTTRVSMAGRAANGWTVTAWTPAPYVKKSPTSNLLVWMSLPSYTPSSSQGFTGVGSASGILSIGANAIPFLVANNILGDSRGQTNAISQLAGVVPGPQAINIAYTLAPNQTNWDGVFCPTTTDSPFLPASSMATIIIGELEP